MEGRGVFFMSAWFLVLAEYVRQPFGVRVWREDTIFFFFFSVRDKICEAACCLPNALHASHSCARMRGNSGNEL